MKLDILAHRLIQEASLFPEDMECSPLDGKWYALHTIVYVLLYHAWSVTQVLSWLVSVHNSYLYE